MASEWNATHSYTHTRSFSSTLHFTRAPTTRATAVLRLLVPKMPSVSPSHYTMDNAPLIGKNALNE